MFPIFMRMLIKDKQKKAVRLFLPVFLAWIILFAIMIALIPLVLLASLITWGRGLGPRILLFYPMIFSLLWALSGLYVEIKNPEKEILILFK
jgi:hypothetical protein